MEPLLIRMQWSTGGVSKVSTVNSAVTEKLKCSNEVP